MKRGSPDPPLDTTHDDYDCILYPIKLLVLGEWEQQEACNQKVTEASQETLASSGDPTHPHNSAQNTESYGSYRWPAVISELPQSSTCGTNRVHSGIPSRAARMPCPNHKPQSPDSAQAYSTPVLATVFIRSCVTKAMY